MRIATITFQRSHSYGAFLQTFALVEYLRGLGHDVRVIDYNPAYRDARIRRWTGRHRGFNLDNVLNYALYKTFRNHIERHIPLTSRAYRTLDELRRHPPSAEAYICGSDQIWCAAHHDGALDPAYFACFGDSSVRRVSYAASLGSDTISTLCHESLRDNIACLDHVSVRERVSCEVVEHVTGRTCSWVLDPTLLISDYSRLYGGRPAVRGRYLLAYDVQMTRFFERVLRAASAVWRLPIVRVAQNPRIWRFSGRSLVCSPSRWLSLFAGASGVVTSSFHGTAFAILFRKPFLSLGAMGEARGCNVRPVNLLSELGLERVFVKDDGEIHRVTEIAEAFDWGDVHERLDPLRVHSGEFLQNALHSR